MKFKIKDIVFLAIMSALMILLGVPIAPIVMTSTVLGSQSAAMAFTTALVTCIAIRKTKREGTLIAMGLFSGLLLMFMAPIMFVAQVGGAVISEGIMFLIFRDYSRKKAIYFTSGTYSFFMIPMIGVFNIFAKGKGIADQIGSPLRFTLICVLALGLGLLGSFIGHKIADALERAGKI